MNYYHDLNQGREVGSENWWQADEGHLLYIKKIDLFLVHVLYLLNVYTWLNQTPLLPHLSSSWSTFPTLPIVAVTNYHAGQT